MSRLVGTWTVEQYARHSFLRGAASVFDLRGATLRQYRAYRTSEEVDRRAVEQDWTAVGNDLRSAVDRYSHRA